MLSNAERQKSYRERKRAKVERQEFEQFINKLPFSSSLTDLEKYEKFQAHRQTVKIYERKRKRAEAARERRKQTKLLQKQRSAEEQESKISERKRKRAQAAREKRKQNKLLQKQGSVEEQESITAKRKQIRDEAAREKRKQNKFIQELVSGEEQPEELIVEPPLNLLTEYYGV